MRIDRLLSQSGYGSRSEIKKLLRGGVLLLDGEILRDPAREIAPEEEGRLLLHGSPLLIRRGLWLMLNKPAGLVSALTDEKLPTVADLMPPEFLRRKLALVGRLDRDTTGLLLLTDDGTLNHRLCAPKWGIERCYRVEYRGLALGAREVALVQEGLRARSGEQFRPARLEPLEPGSALITLTEGRFHEVKIIFQILDREVTALHRERYGPLTLDPSLAAGEYRDLIGEELELLYASVALERI